MTFESARALRRASIGVFCAALTFLCPLPVTGQAALRPLDPEVVTRLRSIHPSMMLGAFSPDGKLLAYAVSEAAAPPQGGGRYAPSSRPLGVKPRTAIWLADVETGRSWRITDGIGAEWAPSWSPDGQSLAYFSDRDGFARVWIWNRGDGAKRRISDAIVRTFSEFRPLWSGDGQSIITLVLKEGALPPELQADSVGVSSAGSRDESLPRVTVYRSTARERDTSAATGLESALLPATSPAVDSIIRDATERWAPAVADVAAIRVADGHVRRLEEDQFVWWMEIAPDGRSIAYMRQTGRYVAPPSQLVYDLVVAPVDEVRSGQGPRIVARDALLFAPAASWSPDSRRLAFLTGGNRADGELYVAHVADSIPRAVPGFTGEQIDTSDRWARWSADGGMLVFASRERLWYVDLRSSSSPTVRSVAALGLDREIVDLVSGSAHNLIHPAGGEQWVDVLAQDRRSGSGIYRINVRTGRTRRLHEVEGSLGTLRLAPLGSPDGRRIAYLHEASDRSADIWIADRNLERARRLTSLNPALDSVELGRAVIIDYLGLEGRALRGALLLPSGYQTGTRYPLVVYVYPGRTSIASRHVRRFGLIAPQNTGNMQVLATRGFAVLHPEIPIRVGTPMADIAAGLDAAVNRVIELGIADPGRIAVLGGSFGGYSTLVATVSSSRYSAAIMEAGFGDLGSHVYRMNGSGFAFTSYAEDGQAALGGTPWEYRERYIDNSPFYALDRVTTPLLILHGAEDRNVLARDAEQVFTGLRRLGREVEYRRYDGEGHVMSGSINVIDAWNARLRWLDRWMPAMDAAGRPGERPTDGRR